MADARHVRTPIHGRYLYEKRDSPNLLVGFHGYAETAEKQLAEIERIPGIELWSVAAIQALHPFYAGRTGEVVASWMTRLDRDAAIQDNLQYVRNVLSDLPPRRLLVFVGFSQGAAMAFRAAALADIQPSGLIILGGDMPAELRREDVSFPPILLARGKDDAWYTAEKFKEDLRFLSMLASVTPLEFVGAHEWTNEFRRAAGDFLERLEPSGIG